MKTRYYLFLLIKRTNLYKLSNKSYNKLLTDNITNSHKETNTSAINNINKEAKCTAERLHLTTDQFS